MERERPVKMTKQLAVIPKQKGFNSNTPAVGSRLKTSDSDIHETY